MATTRKVKARSVKLQKGSIEIGKFGDNQDVITIRIGSMRTTVWVHDDSVDTDVFIEDKNRVTIIGAENNTTVNRELLWVPDNHAWAGIVQIEKNKIINKFEVVEK